MTERQGEMDRLIARVRRRAFGIGAVAIAAAFAWSWRSGASLTIAAAVVIFSFLVFEKLTDRLVPQQQRPGTGTILPLLLVTAASVVLLGVVLLRWRGFDPIAGAAGLSVVVLAIIPEVWSPRRREE